MASSITEFAHLKIPLEEIEKATNNFAEKNIVGRGGFGNVYRGKLIRSGERIKFSARRLDRKSGQGDIEFLTEISMLSCLEHENLVSMIGFCDEKGEKIIVNKYYAKGSLSMHLSKPTLTWIQRVDIALGIARAIEYIHDKVGQSYYVIHRNINSSTILLDENLVPKLSGFEFSIKHQVDQRNQVFVSQTIGTYGYIDPEIYKTVGVTHKSDIYSLGVVLCEIVCGRQVNDDTPLATRNKGKMSLLEIIDKEVLSDLIYKDYGSKLYWSSILLFSSIANDCLLTDRSCRKDAVDVVSSLKDISEFLHDNNFEAVETVKRVETETSTYCKDVISFFCFKFVMFLLNPLAYIPILGADENDNSQLTFREIQLRGGSSHTPKVNILEHLRIPLKDIQLATNNFSEESIFTFTSITHHHLRLRHLGIFYTAELECLDREYMFSMEGKTIHELPKRRYKVWILRIHERDDIFNKQIEILGRCKHPNIESLLGFCDESCVRILVYEFTNKEALHSRIHSPDLTWERCLKICLNVARGLNYLQIENGGQKPVIHGNITIDKIDVDINGGAKLVDFTYSLFLNTDQDDDALHHVLPAVNYTDPEYLESGKLTRESDVYSFGVVMFEIFSGSLIGDLTSNVSRVGHKDERFMQLVRWSYEYGWIKKDLASKFKEENCENKYFLPKGPNKDSLDTFLDIMYMCLAKTQNQRPQMEVVLKELEKALSFQENHKDPFRMSYEDIKSATDNFSPSKKIGEGGFGIVFKGELAHEHSTGYYNIVAKLDKSQGQWEGEKLYYNELQILYKYMHGNIIGLLGYSNETNERLIVYEQASKGSLDGYLNYVSLTWRNRLKICIDVATGLDFLHGGIGGQSVVIHRDIKSANILLFDNWNAKVGDFGLSLITTINKETDFIFDHPCGTMCYVDPVYLNSKILTVESDIYSFGVLLFEILYGREAYKISKSGSESLLNYIKDNLEKGKEKEIVFEAIRKEIMPKSLTTFLKIVQSCLVEDRDKRPTSKEVLAQLKMTLEFQNEEA